jgi:hypothetical protein
MATIRRAGFGTVFELEDSKVGIGTDAATHTLQALGNIRSEDATDIGISSLTTYQGFVDKEARFTTGQIDNQSQSGSTSGEIVIDGDVTVSSATTFTSGPQNLTVTDTFTLPSGDTNSRELKPTAGSLRFNQDFATLEFYTGNNWATVNTFTEMQNSPGNRGRALFAGGSPSMVHISFVNIATEGNAKDFGDMTYGLGGLGGCSSATRGLFAGGGNPVTDTINYFTIASESSGIDFGNLTASMYGAGGHSSSTRGIWAGGNTGSQVNVIQYVEINTLGNALDFGDLTRAVTGYECACGSPVRMLHAGGKPSAYEGMIDFWNISSKGNATDFGDLTQKKNNSAGLSNNTRGVWCRGELSDGVNVARCDYVTIASTGNATDFGSISVGRYATGASNQTRGIVAGGYASSESNLIEFITIATTGNAVYFGDDTQLRYAAGGLSDSHGGLGGF